MTRAEKTRNHLYESNIETMEFMEPTITTETKNKKKLVIFTDMGDTIIDEGSQVFALDNPRLVLWAECIPGAKETLFQLYEEGFRIAMVADGIVPAFENLIAQHGFAPVFESKTVSKAVGEVKPSRKMFQTALERMHLTDGDKYRIIMIGNNIARDVAGANRFGIRSVLINWSPRYNYVPNADDEVPDYTVTDPRELIPLIHRLEEELA